MDIYDVGIIIPVYCKTEVSLVWLDECLHSAVAQGCKVSMYDDGSPMDISGVVDKYLGKYDIVYGKGEINKGVSHARNEAVAQCDSKLIMPLDCDDIIVDGAIGKLLLVWNDVPIYPDIEKFGNVNIKHYKLLEFSCEHLYNHVGFTSVNVMHSKDQWKNIGGWDRSIYFYEDGEYNARLLGTYCGVRYPLPLIRYRYHDDQRTVEYKDRAHRIAKELQTKIRSYDMACPGCSKKRVSPSNLSVTGKLGVTRMSNITGRRSDSTVNIHDIKLPVEFEGKVLVQYVGGRGRGKHNYRGIVSTTSYRVLYNDVLYADPRDVREAEDSSSQSMLVRIYPKPSKKVEQEPVGENVVALEKSPRNIPDREPVGDFEEELEIDPSNMTISQIKEIGLDAEEAKVILEWEKEGKARKNVIKYLEGVIEND